MLFDKKSACLANYQERRSFACTKCTKTDKRPLSGVLCWSRGVPRPSCFQLSKYVFRNFRKYVRGFRILRGWSLLSVVLLFLPAIAPRRGCKGSKSNRVKTKLSIEMSQQDRNELVTRPGYLQLVQMSYPLRLLKLQLRPRRSELRGAAKNPLLPQRLCQPSRTSFRGCWLTSCRSSQTLSLGREF